MTVEANRIGNKANEGVGGAVIYTRVSTGEQAEHGTSLDSQRDACRAKALVLGLPIVAEYKDAGISGGFLLTRPGMQAVLADIRAGRADTLICANLSRYSRDVEHQQAIRKEVRLAGGRIVFCDMDFDDTPEGDLAFGVLGTFAEYERKVIRERTMRGKRKRAEEGQQPQRSRPPFGYHIVTNAQVECGQFPPEMRGRYLIDEEKAPIARRLFADYAEGETLPKLAKALNREGIPTPANGRRWQPFTLHLILTNPVYKGEPVSGRQKCYVDESRLEQRHKVTGRPITQPHVRRTIAEDQRLRLSAPPLVSAELWENVQQTLEDNRTFRKGNPRRVLMLSGKTVCPHCGARTVLKYQNANGKRYTYLTCGRRLAAQSLTGEKLCVGDRYPLSVIEEATVKVVEKAWQDPAAIAAAEAEYSGDLSSLDADTLRRELAALDRALEEVRQDEAAAVRAQIAGIRAGASPDAYSELFADSAARRKDLEDRRGLVAAALQGDRPGRHAGRRAGLDRAVQQALQEAHRLLSDPEVPGVEKRDALIHIIDRVICHKDGVEVEFVPGLFGETGDAPDINFYTICMGIRTQR